MHREVCVLHCTMQTGKAHTQTNKSRLSVRPTFGQLHLFENCAALGDAWDRLWIAFTHTCTNKHIHTHTQTHKSRLSVAPNFGQLHFLQIACRTRKSIDKVVGEREHTHTHTNPNQFPQGREKLTATSASFQDCGRLMDLEISNSAGDKY